MLFLVPTWAWEFIYWASRILCLRAMFGRDKNKLYALERRLRILPVGTGCFVLILIE